MFIFEIEIAIKCIILCVVFWLIGKLITHFTSDYDKCYDVQEDCGVAVFGCCSGMDSELCKTCPHFVDVNEGEK